ncbi:MAG: MarR family transcriptional regulator [Clostridia bacterium]|nr:MarR family transcriptional regulator [Clostridia bacterium]
MLSRFERFSVSISELSRYLHKISADEMEKYGLKGPYAIYLLTMHRYSEGITATELSERCDRNKADVSRAVTAMEEKGLVYRKGASYRARLILTPEGEKAAHHVGERARLAVEMGGKGLTDREREIFYTAMETIADNLRAMSKDGMPEYTK